jgi:hypothetical protein
VNCHKQLHKPFLSGLHANVSDSQTANEDIFQSIKRNIINKPDLL